MSEENYDLVASASLFTSRCFYFIKENSWLLNGLRNFMVHFIGPGFSAVGWKERVYHIWAPLKPPQFSWTDAAFWHSL